jgi:hypothetical protein
MVTTALSGYRCDKDGSASATVEMRLRKPQVTGAVTSATLEGGTAIERT